MHQKWEAKSYLLHVQEALKAEKMRGQEFRRRPSLQQDGNAGGDWRTLRPPPGPSAAGRQFAWRHRGDGPEGVDSKHSGASADLLNGPISNDEIGVIPTGKRLSYDIEVSCSFRSLSACSIQGLAALCLMFTSHLFFVVGFSREI